MTQILVGFNDALLRTRRDAAPECIHESFEEQAARTPHRVALVCDDRQFTYGELDARATQLARYLEWLGVEPDTCVVICMGRSSDIVLAILSVLKAGGAYVPLDPGLPADRVKSILNDARPRAVLTLSAVRHELPDHGAPVVCLDADWPLISTKRSDASLGRRASGANLAYVLFTSGSTGIPKGVAVEHRQLVNYVDSVSEALDLPSGASYACVSTFAADLGNTVIFPALCSGGTLHVISQDRVTDADAFADYFSRHSIDCLKIVPSHLQALLTAPCPERALPKRRLVLGGEASSWSLIRKVHELAPECLVFNHYGPTETTVGACTYRIAAADAFNERTASVPIGRPIANVRMHVLDSDLEPVPIWMPGEIYIGGAGLARGYLNRPDLTAESFIPNPFEPGVRLYRTGDIGRYLPNGSIQFLGRTDHQVKIRGFRIELGEIENVLAQHRSVRQAIVLVREDVPGEKQIAACVVAEDPGTLRPEEIRDFVKSKVPEHMVPSMFFVLDAWPLTRNGKVDRSRLLQLQQQPQRTDTASRRPATPLESTLLTIFAEVLRREAVDVDSNFFDIGGHSLLAVQVLSRIRRALNVTLPVRVLFETPTVEGIAAAIAAASDTASASESTLAPGGAQAPSGEAARIPRRKADDPVPLSYTQEQMWFIDQLAPSSASYNMACAFQLKGLLNIAALERAFNEIVRRHESLRTTFDSVEGVPMQVIAPSLTIALPVITVPAHSGTGSTDAAIRLAGEHARQPFDLAKGPLLRCRLWKVPGEEHLLVIALHHIVNDGWSWSVLFSELSALYEAYSEERQAALPESPIQYRRLCPVGERAAAPGPARHASRVLVATARERPDALGSPDGPSARCRAVVSWHGSLRDISAGAQRATRGAEPGTWCNALHDAGRCVQRVAVPLDGAGRHCRRDNHCRPQPSRTGAVDRAVHQHPRYCAPISQAIQRSASCCSDSAKSPLRPTRIRKCRSTRSSKGCTRSAASATGPCFRSSSCCTREPHSRTCRSQDSASKEFRWKRALSSSICRSRWSTNRAASAAPSRIGPISSTPQRFGG